MDAQIRRLVLTGAEQNDVQLLSNAFRMLQQNFQLNLVQSKDTIGQDIYVLLAESALDLNANSIADESLQMFFSSSPVKSQFVGRAYLCQFRMYMPKTALDFASLANAIPFLQKCLSFAAASHRYQFLVYNASVVYFNCVRPFLRDGYRKYLCESFQQIVDTLMSIREDQDFVWQAQLFLELVRCYLDKGDIDKAKTTSVQLLQLCQNKQLSLLSNVLRFLATTNLFEAENLFRYAQSSLFNQLLIELASIHREILENRPTIKTHEHLKNVFDRIVALPLRSAAVGNLSATGARDNSELTPASARLDGALTSHEKHRLLVEAGRLSLLLRYTDLTKVILDALSNIRLKEPEHLLEVRLLQAEYTVKSLGENEQLYSKSSVETRIRAIELTEETLESLVRTNQIDLVQMGCINLWNLSLPLLQSNLRARIRKPLTTLVTILERIQSLNWLLRTQAHFELAKIEEDIEQLDSAKMNLLKARQLDDIAIYSSRIDLALERLHLRSELYKISNNIDDRVGTIIEQAGKASNGNKNKQRALLIDACLLLAQDTFQVVLDSENPNAIGKMRANPTAQLKGFAEHYEKCIQNIVHYARLMPETDQDKRLKLWADLTMIARKQEIWDVCRTTARFCLLSDTEQRRSILSNENKSVPSLFQRDLIRLLAEIHFIAGEAEIEFIRERRIELFDTPIRPPMPTVPAAQRIQAQQESDNDWKHYCQWLQHLSTRACAHFSTGATLGQLLNESWLVCRAGEYLWNYTRHLFYSNRLRLILDPLLIIVNGLKKIGHEREILLLVNLSVALANAYITPLSTPNEDAQTTASAESNVAPPVPAAKKGGKAEQQPIGTGPSGSTSSNVKNDDCKAALEVCEYAINQTNEGISIRDRQTLLQMWVTIKQYLQQSIKSAQSTVLGDEDENTSSLNIFSRAVLAVDILSRLDNNWHENKDGMNLKQTVSFVDQCTWTDPLVELQLWCRLAIIANRANDIETSVYARDKTLELIPFFQTRKIEKFQLSLANEYVSRACGAHAECLLKQQIGQKQDRKEALAVLVEAASYASKADLYELTMHLSRHFWNTCRPVIKRKLERALLLDPLNELIHHINLVSPKSIVTGSSDNKEVKEEEEEKTNAGVDTFKPKKQPLPSKNEKKGTSIEDDQSQGMIIPTPSSNDDAQVRSALYGIIIQIYMDKHAWHSALDIIDNALQILPRTHHRLLLYKYRILIKSKLGLSISMDMIKFREQGELALAKMWREVALMAKNRQHVIYAYQYAIGTLQSLDTYWPKIDYILELACWLYSNEYLIDNVVDLIEWAIDLLLTSFEAYKEQQSSALSTYDKNEMNKTDRGTTEMAEAGSDTDQAHLGRIKAKIPNRLLPDLSISEIVEVRRLEYLCRCHVLLAFMTRRNQPEYPILLQKAYWFLMRLWQRGLSDSIDIIKDVDLEAAAAADAMAATDSAGKKQQQKGAPGSAAKKKPPAVAAGKSVDKSTAGKSSITFDTSTSKSPSEWALFLPADDLLNTFTLSQAKERGINKNTIPKPLLSFYYFDMFVRLLRDYGYHHMSLPVLSLMRLLDQILLQSSSVRTYVLLRIQQVCQELNLLESMQTICQLIRPFSIRDDDLTATRADMIIYTKLLAQQRDEEAQFESTLGSGGLKSEARSCGTSAYSSPASRMATSDPKSFSADLPGDRQALSKLIVRHIWLQTAHILFELHFLQEAKEMLQEILNNARTYDDQTTEKRAYVLLGKIALHEHRFDQAIELAMQGQQIPIDEQDWYQSVVTVIDALRLDTEQDSYKQKKIRSLLDVSIKRLESIAQLHVNKIMSIAYAASLLTSKRIDLDSSEVMNKSMANTVEDKSLFHYLYDILQQQDISFVNMLNLDRFDDACDIILSRSIPIWKRFVRDSIRQNDQQRYLCRALSVLEDLTVILAERWRQIRIITIQSDLASIQMPIQRQFIRVQLEIVSILIDLFKIQAQQMFNERLRRKHTHATSLAVEDFVGDSKGDDETDRDEDGIIKWSEMIKMLPDKLTASLMAILDSTGAHDKTTKAKVLFYLAQVYSILGQNVGTDYPLEWNKRIKDVLAKINEIPPEKTGSKRIGSHSSGGINRKSFLSVEELMTDQTRTEINRSKDDLNQSMSLLGQSMEFALQALNLALAIQDKMLIRDISLLLCDSIGQFDPFSSIIYLALSQSATASIYTESVLRQACNVPSDSELASLFALLNLIKREQIVTNANNGVVHQTILERLKTYWPWKYMTIRSQYYELTKDMPTSYNFLILHYSPNGENLYAALFNSKMSSAKGSTSTTLTKQTSIKPTGSPSGFVTPQIMKIAVDRTKLIELITKFNQWKRDYAQLLQRYDVKMQHSRDKQAMLNSEQVKQAFMHSSAFTSKSIQSDPVDTHSIDQFKEHFINELLPELNAYFDPIAPLFSTYLEVEKQFELRSSLSSDHLILLVDPRLAQLPLEALNLFQHVQIGGIARDFSIQSLYHRLNPTFDIDETTNPSDDSKGKKVTKTEKDGGDVASELQTIDAVNTFYLTEPILVKTSTGSPSTPFDLLRQRFPQLVAKWKTFKQDGLTFNTVELERIIADAQGVIYYGAHTISELIGPYKCPTISKNGCTLMCSFDRTSTSAAATIPNETLFSMDDNGAIQLDRSTEIALLWSSGGIKSIVLNQWKSTINENESALINTFTDVATLRCSLSQALRLYVYPYFRPVDVDPTISKDPKAKPGAVSSKKVRSPSPKSKQQRQPTATNTNNKKKSSPVRPPENIIESSPTEPIEERQRPSLQLQQLNTIIFGLPNLTFLP